MRGKTAASAREDAGEEVMVQYNVSMLTFSGQGKIFDIAFKVCCTPARPLQLARYPPPTR